MPEAEPRVRGLAPVVPAVAAAAAYGWARWCFAGTSAPSSTVALVVGAMLVVGASAVYFALAGGSGGFFGALFLAMGLLLTVAATEQAQARSAVATCAVREVRTEVQRSFGEGGTDKTTYLLALDCPGGYPDELKDDRAVAPKGAEIRVAYDPRRRLSPQVQGGSSPWKPAVSAALLLAFSTLLAAVRRAPDA
ncbi:hypothetical protein [Streptomyces sp. NPDC051183]|uniref:hypothetical protein n=1 Tax=unclassified Streptomyces TaxID=2593676 RepID=UPI0034266F3C